MGLINEKYEHNGRYRFICEKQSHNEDVFDALAECGVYDVLADIIVDYWCPWDTWAMLEELDRFKVKATQEHPFFTDNDTFDVFLPFLIKYDFPSDWITPGILPIDEKTWQPYIPRANGQYTVFNYAKFSNLMTQPVSVTTNYWTMPFEQRLWWVLYSNTSWTFDHFVAFYVTPAAFSIGFKVYNGARYHDQVRCATLTIGEWAKEIGHKLRSIDPESTKKDVEAQIRRCLLWILAGTDKLKGQSDFVLAQIDLVKEWNKVYKTVQKYPDLYDLVESAFNNIHLRCLNARLTLGHLEPMPTQPSYFDYDFDLDQPVKPSIKSRPIRVTKPKRPSTESRSKRKRDPNVDHDTIVID